MDEIFKDVFSIQTRVTEIQDAFIFETILPFCEGITERRILKKDLETALMKQKPMTPNLMQDVTGIYASCPRCGNRVKAIFGNPYPGHIKIEATFPNYCSNCGQSLEWRKEA